MQSSNIHRLQFILSAGVIVLLSLFTGFKLFSPQSLSGGIDGHDWSECTNTPYLFACNHLAEKAAVNRATRLMLQDTVHYQLNTTESVEEFAALVPIRGHTVPVGKQEITHTVALFHQLRCLDILRSDYAAQRGETRMGRHCLNYLRQSILCLADVKLEPAVNPFLDKPHIVRFKSDYVCRDWTAVYAAANMYLK